MTTISSTYCPRLRCLQPVLKRWTRLNPELALRWRRSKDRDFPWWYRERAVLSTFAGAVWLSKGTVLEEYSSMKRSLLKRSRSGPGRVDLFFTVGKRWFIAEAKQCFPGMVRPGKDRRLIQGCIDSAVAEVGRSRPERMRRLALAFVVPRFPKQHKHTLKSYLIRVGYELRSLEVGAAAWIFPDIEDAPRYKGYLYPGIILLVKEVKRTGYRQ